MNKDFTAYFIAVMISISLSFGSGKSGDSILI